MNSYKNLSTSGVVIPGEGVLESMYVNTAGGTMILYCSPSTAANVGKVISTAEITPAAGYHYLGSIHTTAGVYVVLGQGTAINVTFHIKETL